MRPSEHNLTLVEAPSEELTNVRNLGTKNVEEIRLKIAEYEEDWR